MMQQKQIEISREANRISIIKSEKDMIYQIHHKILDEHKEKYSDGLYLASKAAKTIYNSLHEEYSNHKEKQYKTQIAEIYTFLSNYYNPLTLITNNTKDFNIESLEFFANIIKTNTTSNIWNTCWHFLKDERRGKDLLDKETLELHMNCLEISIEIVSISTNLEEIIKKRKTLDIR